MSDQISTPSFLQTGFDATDEPIAQAEQEAAAKRRVFRFWMPAPKPGEPSRRQVIFLDGEPVSFREHQIPLNGEWGKHFFTCIDGLPGEDGEPMRCPLCELDDFEAYLAAAFTVVDLHEFVTKRGEKRKNQKRLLVVKLQVIKTLKWQAEKRGGLKFTRFEVNRTGDKAPNTGDNWDFEATLTEANLREFFKEEIERDAKAQKDFMAPVDYAKELAPRSLTELQAIAAEFTQAKAAGKEVKF